MSRRRPNVGRRGLVRCVRAVLGVALLLALGLAGSRADDAKLAQTLMEAG